MISNRHVLKQYGLIVLSLELSQPFQSPQQMETVTDHQTKVFAGATMEFSGAWITDPKYDQQFTFIRAIEKKPATTASLENYLGSGLVKGVGPATAPKIVKYFQ